MDKSFEMGKETEIRTRKKCNSKVRISQSTKQCIVAKLLYEAGLQG